MEEEFAIWYLSMRERANQSVVYIFNVLLSLFMLRFTQVFIFTNLFGKPQFEGTLMNGHLLEDL